MGNTRILFPFTYIVLCETKENDPGQQNIDNIINAYSFCPLSMFHVSSSWSLFGDSLKSTFFFGLFSSISFRDMCN